MSRLVLHELDLELISIDLRALNFLFVKKKDFLVGVLGNESLLSEQKLIQKAHLFSPI